MRTAKHELPSESNKGKPLYYTGRLQPNSNYRFYNLS